MGKDNVFKTIANFKKELTQNITLAVTAEEKTEIINDAKSAVFDIFDENWVGVGAKIIAAAEIIISAAKV